jgi:peroxiredoxin
MYKRIAITLAGFLFFGSTMGSLVRATGPVPRKAPDLTIVDSAGKQTRLSSYNGKVVLVEFLMTNCPHCMRIGKMIAKLDWDLKSRGLQAVGVAFDPNVNGQMVKDFTDRFAVTYPVGYVSSETVDAYLGRGAKERMRVPQIVVIDRKGVIRAQSLPDGEKNLEDEQYLRTLLDGLLNEGQPPSDASK